MKRSEFIRNMGLAGVGISLAPIQLFAFSKAATFRLPKAAIHIPHGNFAAAEMETLTLGRFNIECNVQLFMRNGITPCDDDLKVFSFYSGNEQVSISLTRSGTRTVSGTISGIQLNIDSFDSEIVSIAKR